MKKHELAPLENNNQRVLTTEQIADAYGTTTNTITVNFNRNKKHYKEGKHFHLLKGDELKAFKTTLQNVMCFKQSSKLYLWTESGALLHAKSLNTDKAWEVYMHLVDFYFREKEKELAELYAITNRAYETSLEITELQENQISELSNEINFLKHYSVVNAGQQDELKAAARANVRAILGDKDSPTYRLFAFKTYRALWREYRKYFCIDSYRNTPQFRFEEALNVIRLWEPEKWLRRAINQVERDYLEFLETFFDDVDKDGYKRLLSDCPGIVGDFLRAYAD